MRHRSRRFFLFARGERHDLQIGAGTIAHAHSQPASATSPSTPTSKLVFNESRGVLSIGRTFRTN